MRRRVETPIGQKRCGMSPSKLESSAFKNSPFKVLGECLGLTVQEIQKILPKEGS
jgi:hypothetical protein